MNNCSLNFDGQRRDHLTGTYHPGNGYRAYSPILKRFTSPDNWSPFGAGGINSWTYCNGDPVNFSDPSGHMSWQAGLGIALGIGGIAAAIFTCGASLIAAGSISTALATSSAFSLSTGAFALVADVTGLASAFMEDTDPQASAALGWSALAAGLLSTSLGLVSGGYRILNRVTAGLRSKLARINGRVGIPMSGEFRNARFLGANHGAGVVTWNMRFEDTVPLGRRLNIVMNTLEEGGRTRPCNEDCVNNAWVRQSFGPTYLRSFQGTQNEHYDIYRLIMPDSAKAYRSGGHNIATDFRNAQPHPQNIVVGYRGTPLWRGPVVDALQNLYQRAGHMERQGVPWERASAQNALDTLSGVYGEVENAVMVSGMPVVYPRNARMVIDERNWL